MSDYIGDYRRDELIKIEDSDGSIGYYALMQVGGVDEEGEYLLVLEGVAQGEKAYV